eukprot:3843527-Rhodomonas_salina.1
MIPGATGYPGIRGPAATTASPAFLVPQKICPARLGTQYRKPPPVAPGLGAKRVFKGPIALLDLADRNEIITNRVPKVPGYSESCQCHVTVTVSALTPLSRRRKTPPCPAAEDAYPGYPGTR